MLMLVMYSTTNGRIHTTASVDINNIQRDIKIVIINENIIAGSIGLAKSI
jgi:hydrogenase maturation factor